MGLEAAGRSVDQTVGSVANKVKGTISQESSLFVNILRLLFYPIILYIGIDILWTIYMLYLLEPPYCKKPDWKWIGLVSYFSQPDDCEEEETSASGDKNKCNNLGMWKDYANNNGLICAREATKIYKDGLTEKVFGEYTTTELFSYIIIPTVTLLSIAYALIFTTSKPADFIFWIGVATLVYTGVSTLTYTTNIDILPPDQPSPLLYITDKLNLAASDELKYSFMARKSDGSECLVEGTMLGGGIHSPNNAPRYTGSCTEKDLPLE